MKKVLAIALSVVMLLSLGVVFASAAPGYYCGGSEENFSPVGEIKINWDTEASDKLDLSDGDMQDWVDAGYNLTPIGPNQMISWVGGTADNQAAGIPEGWGFQAYFAADSEYLYIGFYVTDPSVALVQDAAQYNHGTLGGDAFQFMVDFDRALGKMMDQDSQYYDPNTQSGQCVFYSFGPMGEEATPVQIAVQCGENDRVLTEANEDHIKGSTAKTESGWCAEFALGWDLLYNDFAYKAYAEGYECSVTEGDPLEVSCALYYQNHEANDQGFSGSEINWAAGTLKGAEAGAQPEVLWTPTECGINLYVEYSEDLTFDCEGIKVYKIGETAPEQTEAPEETEEPTEEATEEPTEEATEAPTDAETKAEAKTEAETKAEEGGCSSVIGSVAVILTAAAAAVVLKKKD